MLVALLLFTLHARASCEWVEISQQHYLKPARTTRVYPQITVVKDIERTTKVNRVYINSSLSKPNWSKGAIYKVPGSESKKLLDREIEKNKPINFEDKPRTEVSKKSAERVYYNKDNVKRITFTSTEASLKPLEVLNLSDLDYNEEDFPSIEIDDGKFSNEQFEHTKHLTAVIPTEDEDSAPDNLQNTLKSHNKNHDRKSVSTKAAPKKDIIVERKTSPNQNATISFKRKEEEQLNFTNSSVRDNSNKIVTLNQKSSSTAHSTESEKIKYEPKYKSKNSSGSYSTSQRTENENNSETFKIPNSKKQNRIQIMEVSSEKSSHKLTQENPKLEKNVLRINELPKPTQIRNPEEVMLEEILHESKENLEDLNLKTPSIGTVKKVSSKSTITKVNPKINESDCKDFQAVESQIQRTQNKNIGTVNIRETDNNAPKNIIKESVTTATASNKIEQSKEIENFHRNAVKPLPAETEKLFEHNKSNNHKEDRPVIVTTLENNHSEEQENQNVFILTATSDQEETKIFAKSPSTETTATVEFTTKPSPIEQTTTASEEKVESVKLDSKKPPAIIKNEDQDHETKETEETLANDTAADTLGTLVKVLKLVTETISRNTRKSVKGKMRYLEELRDTIMASIEQRLEAVFPDDIDSAAPRRARSAQAQGRGHVEFPSSESALMTISFLTFAVFLIKLVLQVIQAYKHKAMVMPAVVATVGRAFHQYSKIKADDVK